MHATVHAEDETTALASNDVHTSQQNYKAGPVGREDEVPSKSVMLWECSLGQVSARMHVNSSTVLIAQQKQVYHGDNATAECSNRLVHVQAHPSSG